MGGSNSNLVDQVESLYEEKEKLDRHLGVTEPDEIIKMVESLQNQVESMYAEREESRPTFFKGQFNEFLRRYNA